ncbi:MAG: choice-of-anchor J domain-containing protein [Ekhidna sp.]
MQSTLLHQTIQTLNFRLQTDEAMRVGLLIFITFLSSNLTAQNRCGTVAPSTGAFENWISTKITERSARANNTQATLYQIPVVVHVFHQGEPVGTGVNLSDDRIKAQIDSLSADFRRRNADASNTPSEFLPVAADVEIEFVLAKQDPSGNPTNGIVRLRGTKDVYRANTDRQLLRSESYWPPANYLNIYVTDLQSFIGYASFPVISLQGIINDTQDSIFDGVIVDFQYFGVNLSTPTFDSFGRTLTHEVGHYMGLRHIWGDGNCSVDDFVSDTPLANTDNGDYTSPCTFPNPDDTQVCVEGEPEMFQNYMDYTDDICMNLFTVGQKTRMRTVMDNAQNRISLVSSPGLNEPVRFLNDLAATEIRSPQHVGCASAFVPELKVANHGTNEITTYDVQLLIDGTPIGGPQSISQPLEPLAENMVTFGMQSVSSSATISFQISNVNGTTDGNPANDAISLKISAPSSMSLPFEDNLENNSILLGEISLNNTWKIAEAPKEVSTNKALVFNAYNNTSSTGTEVLLTPPLDLSGFDDVELSFSYAYAYRQNSFYDGFEVKYSYDCGNTFASLDLFSAFGPQLATVGDISDSEFLPANFMDWNEEKLIIPKNQLTNAYGSEVVLAFVAYSGGGNNLFLDEISIDVSNRAPFNASLTEIDAPSVICADTSSVSLLVKNAGSRVIEALKLEYQTNGVTSVEEVEGITIPLNDSRTITIEIPTPNNLNDIIVEVLEVNQQEDTVIAQNTITTLVQKNTEEDEYPLVIDFESADSWINTSPTNTSIWQRASLSNNGILRANAFDAISIGNESWFVSPALNTGRLDSAGLFFRTSYASRVGKTDRLRVLASRDCGNSYSVVLLDADSDSLAMTETNVKWVPLANEDWKEFELDLAQINAEDNIRIAFVFTNGNGNDLYIDDITIRSNDPPTYQDVVRTYPNPATERFNVGLNLPSKESVTVRLIDMSGRIVFEEQVENAFNQILEYKAPGQEGLYFLNIIGRQFKSTQKLFISR